MKPKRPNKLKHAGVRSLIGWSTILFLGRITGAIATYATQIFIARWFGADVLGQYVLAFSVLLIAGIIATGGFAEASPRFVGLAMTSGESGQLRGYVRRAQQVTLIGSIFVAVSGAVITWFFVSETYKSAILIALLILPASASLRLHASFAQGYSRLVLKEFPGSVLRPIFFLIAVFCLWRSMQDVQANTLMVLHGLIIAAIMVFMVFQISSTTKVHTEGAIPVYQDKVWISVIPPLAAAGAFYMYLPEIINLTVSPFLDSIEIAYLNAAMRTGMLVMFVIHAIDSAFLPRATHLLSSQTSPELESWVIKAAMLKVIATSVALAIFWLGGEKILGLFGEEFQGAATALCIFASGLFLRALIAPPLQLMILSGQQKACVLASIASFVVLAISAYFIVPSLGLIGASVCAVLSMLTWGVVLTNPAKSRLGFHPAPLTWLISRTLVS